VRWGIGFGNMWAVVISWADFDLMGQMSTVRCILMRVLAARG
jgi:hypothetical protein